MVRKPPPRRPRNRRPPPRRQWRSRVRPISRRPSATIPRATIQEHDTKSKDTKAAQPDSNGKATNSADVADAGNAAETAIANANTPGDGKVKADAKRIEEAKAGDVAKPASDGKPAADPASAAVTADATNGAVPATTPAVAIAAAVRACCGHSQRRRPRANCAGRAGSARASGGCRTAVDRCRWNVQRQSGRSGKRAGRFRRPRRGCENFRQARRSSYRTGTSRKPWPATPINPPSMRAMQPRPPPTALPWKLRRRSRPMSRPPYRRQPVTSPSRPR